MAKQEVIANSKAAAFLPIIRMPQEMPAYSSGPSATVK